MKKSLITLLAAITIAGAGIEVINTNNTSVQAKKIKRAKHHKARRHHIRKIRRSKKRSNKKHSRRRTSKRRRNKKVSKKQNAVQRKNEWWKNLPEPNFNPNESLFGKMHTALQATGEQRKADDYAIMKQVDLVNSDGSPKVSIERFEAQMCSMDADASDVTNSILNHK